MKIRQRTHPRIASLSGQLIHNQYLNAKERSNAGSYLEGAKVRYAWLTTQVSSDIPRFRIAKPSYHEYNVFCQRLITSQLALIK